jgi:hypothetical protein
MSIEEGEEVQAKRIYNIFNKIITENFPNLKKVLPIQVQECLPGHQTDLTKIEPPHSILSLKQQYKEQRKNIEGCKREKTNNIKEKP